MEPSDQIAAAIRDARARIMWGEAVDEVLQEMLERGVEEEFAANVIQTARKERAAEARAVAIKRMVIGGLIILVSLVPIVLMLLAHFISMALFAGCSAGAAYGLIKVVLGISLLLEGPDFRGSVSDLDS